MLPLLLVIEPRGELLELRDDTGRIVGERPAVGEAKLFDVAAERLLAHVEAVALLLEVAAVSGGDFLRAVAEKQIGLVGEELHAGDAAVVRWGGSGKMDGRGLSRWCVNAEIHALPGGGGGEFLDGASGQLVELGNRFKAVNFDAHVGPHGVAPAKEGGKEHSGGTDDGKGREQQQFVPAEGAAQSASGFCLEGTHWLPVLQTQSRSMV